MAGVVVVVEEKEVQSGNKVDVILKEGSFGMYSLMMG